VLRFDLPVRLIRKKRLLQAPTFADVVLAALRRIALLAGLERSTEYRDIVRATRQQAAAVVTKPWRGERQDLVRWSAAQQREVELFGVTGVLELPQGPGMLWPLLAAAQWCHLGKGTVFGMGGLQITS